MRVIALCAVLCSAQLAGGCAAVSVKTTVTMSLPTTVDPRSTAVPATYRYVVEQSEPLFGLALACLATGLFYGGACWAFLAMPTSEYQLAVINEVLADVAPVLRCAQLQGVSFERTGFLPTPRRVALLRVDDSVVDVRRLHEVCRRPLSAADTDLDGALDSPLPPPSTPPAPAPLGR